MIGHLFAWITAGSILGLLASLIVGTRWKKSALLNILGGITGAVMAGLFLTPLINTEAKNDEFVRSGISSAALLIPLFGAIILVAVTNVVRHLYEHRD